jgi:hypothetical protein
VVTAADAAAAAEAAGAAEVHLTPSEKAKIERAKKLPKDPTEILLDSVVQTPSSYTAWTPSNDPPPQNNQMKAMLASLDDPSFLRLRETHKLNKDARRLDLMTRSETLSQADAEAVKPAVQVLIEAAHSEKSSQLELLAQKLATLPPQRAARFLEALQTKLQDKAKHAQEVPTESPAAHRASAAFLQKQKAVSVVEEEWSNVDLGWKPVSAEADAVGTSFGETATACDNAAKTLSDLRPSLIAAHADARGAIDVNVDMVLRGLSRIGERMATGAEELQAAARLIQKAGGEGVQRRNALLQTIRSGLRTVPRAPARPAVTASGKSIAQDELAAVSFAAQLLPAVQQ